MTPDSVARDYRAAFLRFLPRRDEAALHSGYELGRSAVTHGVSLLELVRIHHEVLVPVLVDSTAEDLPDVAAAASTFLVEVLATFDMTQRGLRDGETG
jgi:hypothetical protein